MKALFEIQEGIPVKDGIGGKTVQWSSWGQVRGYIDMLGGTDLNSIQNAITEESTHILIIPIFKEGITDKMRIVDEKNRFYSITYSDNPVGQKHHNEIYLKYGGVLNE